MPPTKPAELPKWKTRSVADFFGDAAKGKKRSPKPKKREAASGEATNSSSVPRKKSKTAPAVPGQANKSVPASNDRSAAPTGRPAEGRERAAPADGQLQEGSGQGDGANDDRCNVRSDGACAKLAAKEGADGKTGGVEGGAAGEEGKNGELDAPLGVADPGPPGVVQNAKANDAQDSDAEEDNASVESVSLLPELSQQGDDGTASSTKFRVAPGARALGRSGPGQPGGHGGPGQPGLGAGLSEENVHSGGGVDSDAETVLDLEDATEQVAGEKVVVEAPKGDAAVVETMVAATDGGDAQSNDATSTASNVDHAVLLSVEDMLAQSRNGEEQGAEGAPLAAVIAEPATIPFGEIHEERMRRIKEEMAEETRAKQKERVQERLVVLGRQIMGPGYRVLFDDVYEWVDVVPGASGQPSPASDATDDMSNTTRSMGEDAMEHVADAAYATPSKVAGTEPNTVTPDDDAGSGTKNGTQAPLDIVQHSATYLATAADKHELTASTASGTSRATAPRSYNASSYKYCGSYLDSTAGKGVTHSRTFVSIAWAKEEEEDSDEEETNERSARSTPAKKKTAAKKATTVKKYKTTIIDGETVDIRSYTARFWKNTCWVPGCNKSGAKKIVGLCCAPHASEREGKEYGRGKVLVKGNALVRESYMCCDGKEEPAELMKSRNGQTTYRIPIKALIRSSDIEQIDDFAKVYNESYGISDAKMETNRAAAARARGDADAPALKVFRRENTGESLTSATGQNKCAVFGCPDSAAHNIAGISCGLCAAKEWAPDGFDDELRAYVCYIPGTEHFALVPLHKGRPSFGDDAFAFLAYGHLVEGSDDWKSRESQFLERKERIRERAEAKKAEREAELESIDLERATQEYLAGELQNVQPIMDAIVLYDDSWNHSKGRWNGTTLAGNEAVAHLIRKARNPKFLKADGTNFTAADLFKPGGILYGKVEISYHGIGPEQISLDTEEHFHFEYQDVPGRYYENVGGGQRIATRGGEWGVGTAVYKDLLKMVRDGKVFLSLDMNAKEKARYLSYPGIEIGHFRKPAFDDHIKMNEYMKKRHAQKKAGLIKSGEALLEEIGIKKPLVIRLQGTNVEEAKKLIEGCGFRMILADDLEDAAEKAVGVAKIVEQAQKIKVGLKFEGLGL